MILDDTAARVTEMRKVLAEVLPAFEVVAFDNAPDCLDWLPAGLVDAALLCLDHDLGPTRDPSGGDASAGRFDPGIGRDVADALAMYPPVCPVIVHSSNSLAVPGMLRVLRESGWTCSAVMPGDDLRWIPTVWREEVEWYAGNGWFSPAEGEADERGDD
jgi:hypothetical protein